MSKQIIRIVLFGLIFGFSVFYVSLAEDSAPEAVEQQTSESPAPIRDWGEDIMGLAVSLTFPQETYDPWEPIVGKLVITNLAKEEHEVFKVVASGAVFNVYDITVVQSNGSEVPLTSHGEGMYGNRDCWAGIMRQKLKPGEEVVITVHFNRLYDMTRAGEYHITATRRYFFHETDGPPPQVQSKEVVVTVTNRSIESMPEE
jgi:hypothetical protein